MVILLSFTTKTLLMVVFILFTYFKILFSKFGLIPIGIWFNERSQKFYTSFVKGN